MNNIEKKFMELRKKKEKAFIVYITAGYPDIETTARILIALDRNGADLIEIGIPFSDPLADGPTIQTASKRALSGGVTVGDILKCANSLKGKVKTPFVFMTYYNIVLKRGIRRFVADAKACGVEGVIVPDLPAEESKELLAAADREDFSLIFLAAPTSPDDRIKKIARESRGFIYYVSLTGVTGARTCLAADLAKNVRRIKKYSKMPVCAGFGVSNPRLARIAASFADGVIVGSALITVIEKNIGRGDIAKKVGRFAASLADGVKGAAV